MHDPRQDEKDGSEMRQQEARASKFNIDNITMAKKDQISLNVRGDRSAESSSNRKNLRHAGGSGPRRLEKPITKHDARIMKAYQQPGPHHFRIKHSHAGRNIGASLAQSNQQKQASIAEQDGQKESK